MSFCSRISSRVEASAAPFFPRVLEVAGSREDPVFSKEDFEVEPEIEPEDEPEVETEIEPEDEPEVEPEVEPEDEPEVEPEDEPEVEPEISLGWMVISFVMPPTFISKFPGGTDFVL